MEKKINEKEIQGYPLDRETKLMLLKWLKNGFIDKMEFMGLSGKVNKSMTMEEIKEELTRLDLMMNDEICDKFISHNVCKYCHTDRTPREKPLPFYDEWDYK